MSAENQVTMETNPLHSKRHKEVIQRLDRIEQLLIQFNKKEGIDMATMLDAMQALTNQVTATTDAEAAATLVIQGIAAQILAAQGDPSAIQALTTQLQASAANLAAAVTANTPAAALPPVAVPALNATVTAPLTK